LERPSKTNIRKIKSDSCYRNLSECGKDITKTWKLIYSVLKPGSPRSVLSESLNQRASGKKVVKSQLASYFSAVGKTTAAALSPVPSDPH